MTTQRTIMTEQSAGTSTYHDFGYTDRRGRRIGARVTVWTETYAEIGEDEDVCRYYRIAPGTYRVWVGQATRDGKGYGASQNRHICTTEAEREAAIAAYLAAAAKRAAKIK